MASVLRSAGVLAIAIAGVALAPISANAQAAKTAAPSATFAKDIAPIYPAGTVLHVISWHDNSPSKANPDARNWVGSGNRTIDEMGFAWITWYDYTDDEYKEQLEARKGAKKATTTSQGQPQ